MLVGADRHAVVRQIGQVHQQRIQLALQRVVAGSGSRQFVSDTADLGHHFRHVLALALQLADLFGQTVALGLQFFGAGLDALALAFQPHVLVTVEKRLR